MATKVCMLVQYHPFLDARIFKKEAKSLLKMGYDVSMVVPRINGYLFDIDGTPFTDRYLSPTFVHEGVKIVTFEDRRDTIDVMAANLQSGGFASFTNPLTQAGLSVEADVYHAHELLSLYSGIGVKRALKAQGKQVKLVYDSHEIIPDPYAPINEGRKKILHQMLLSMLKEVDYIITVSESMKLWYLSLNPQLQVEIIYNSPPLATGFRPKDYSKNNLVVCYEGNVGKDRGDVEKILGITEVCSKQTDFSFKVIGGVRNGESFPLPPHLAQKVVLTGWVEYQSIPRHMEDVDIGWIDYNLPDTLNHQVALPNKFFSFLNNGVPIVVNKCHQMENVIRTHHCGVVIDKRIATVKDYAEALLHLHGRKQLLKQMSANARRVMEEVYCWEHMEKRLGDVYSRLANPDSVKFVM